jgi:hypothetical protein
MSDYYLEQVTKEREAQAKDAIAQAIAAAQAERDFAASLAELEEVATESNDATIRRIARSAYHAISYLAKHGS